MKDQYHVMVTVDDEEHCFEVVGSDGFQEQADGVVGLADMLRQMLVLSSVTLSDRAAKWLLEGVASMGDEIKQLERECNFVSEIPAK